jgi:hypothetical protein
MTTTYRGTIKNGVVVFDGPPPLPEGTPVRVEPANGQNPTIQRGAANAPHFHPVGAWDGPPGEFDRLLADVQKSRDGDLDLERDAWK